MNCDDITNRLAEGKPLDAAALEHVSGCQSCQSLLHPLETFEPLDVNRLSAIRDRLVASSAPVKPLPSDRTLVTFLMLVFAAFTVAIAYVSHILALEALTPLQMVVYFGFILVAAFVGSAVVVGEMIPGSKLRIRGNFWILATLIGLSFICVALFGNFDFQSFVRLGIPCYRLGSFSALGAGFLLSLFLRKGFLAFPRPAARVVGFLAALTGVAVLALHCPFLNSAHILVWHFGVLLTGWFVGDLIGRRMESR